MKKDVTMRLVILSIMLILVNLCYSQFKGKSSATEKFEMIVDTSSNIISLDKIKSQKAYTMEEREGRGIIASFLISKSIQGIQSLIDNHRRRFSTAYSFAIKDESFYDQVSTLGPFDPTGIRFKGFKIVRLINGPSSAPDTAFVACFSIDTSAERVSEIMNDGIFRLKLDKFVLKSARVRVPKHQRTLNMDFEISFIASFISNNGEINTDDLVGKFIYTIRNAPLDPNDPSYKEYYDSLPLKNPYCTGQSFLIPRSAGYFKNDETKKVEPCWGQGIYSIRVAVKESSKNNFIDKVIIYSSQDVLSIGNASLQKRYSPPPPTNVKVTVKTAAN